MVVMTQNDNGCVRDVNMVLVTECLLQFWMSEQGSDFRQSRRPVVVSVLSQQQMTVILQMQFHLKSLSLYEP